MTAQPDDPGAAAVARADQVAHRAVELAQQIERLTGGPATGDGDLSVAQEKARQAVSRARGAHERAAAGLERAAEAHDRMAGAHDDAADRDLGDPADHRERAVAHRAAARDDRAEADEDRRQANEDRQQADGRGTDDEGPTGTAGPDDRA